MKVEAEKPNIDQKITEHEEKLMNKFVQWPEDEEMETPESNNINHGVEGIGVKKDKWLMNTNGPAYILVELNLKEAVYWANFCGYSLIANDLADLITLNNQMQDIVWQNEARQRFIQYTKIDPGCNSRIIDDNDVLILPVDVELD
ncbi:8185_t:CDS:2 [Dentiscutata erythropus]|uniref:8185_t:CDS:1 n=1 Tax=Dentiscutata erythropus TaxID=1348616 RepID=A0A9N9IDY7_9GLOM|nr:8185_t:CDS:2 [Dentiscutata erythropus]